MPHQPTPALTPEEWESLDYRQRARDLDRWAEERGERGPADDRTEYVAKLGLDRAGSVIVMNRAHDRVLVPPPTRPVLAAFALAGQPFGFTHGDVAAVRRVVEAGADPETAGLLRNLADRLEALLPPVDS